MCETVCLPSLEQTRTLVRCERGLGAWLHPEARVLLELSLHLYNLAEEIVERLLRDQSLLQVEEALVVLHDVGDIQETIYRKNGAWHMGKMGGNGQSHTSMGFTCACR